MGQHSGKRIAHTLRGLAWLLRYPDEAMRGHLQDVGQALRAEQALDAKRLDELDALALRLGAQGMAAESIYVDLFDRGRGCALHLFEHVHGDSRDRGPAMVDLVKTYEQAGLMLDPAELPDHLGVVLEFASTQPPAVAREFIAEFGHILASIAGALGRRGSDYVAVMGALMELAGSADAPRAPQAAYVPPQEAFADQEEPPLDQSWAEPAAFDGCSTQGQAAPDAPQPIRVIRRNDGPGAPGAALR